MGIFTISRARIAWLARAGVRLLVVGSPNTAPRRVLFIDDDVCFLDAVRLVLGERAQIETATTAAEGLHRACPPDVAFVDLGLPDGDGVELIGELGARWPDTPLVVLTVNRNDERVLAAFRRGARGYLFKEDVGERLLPAIEEALAGGAPMSAQVARMALRLMAGLPAPTGAPPDAERLTEQELKLVRSLAGGCSYLQAGNELGVSINTVRSHVRNVYRKLSVGTRTEAVMTALQLGLLQRQ